MSKDLPGVVPRDTISPASTNAGRHAEHHSHDEDEGDPTKDTGYGVGEFGRG